MENKDKNKNKNLDEVKRRIAQRKLEREESRRKSTSNSKFLRSIFITIISVVVLFVLNRFTWFLPATKVTFDTSKINYSKEITLKAKKAGCYEFGLSSTDYNFRHLADTGLMGAEFKIEYFSNNKLLREVVVNKPILSGQAMDTKYTFTGLDTIEIPLDGNTKITARITTLKPFKTNKKIYFYSDETFYKCGKEREMMDEEARIKLLNIKTVKVENEELKPLYNALQNKNNNLIKELIPSKFNANVQIDTNRTPLHFAANNNNYEIIEYLLENGANANMQDVQKHTPLYYAIENNYIESVKLLMEKGNADINLVKFPRSDSAADVLPAIFYIAVREWYPLLDYLLMSPKTNKSELLYGNNIYDYVGMYLGLGKYSKEEEEKRIEQMRKFLSKHGIKPTEYKGIKYDPAPPKKKSWF